MKNVHAHEYRFILFTGVRIEKEIQINFTKLLECLLCVYVCL